MYESDEEDGEGEDEDDFVEVMNEQGLQAGSQAIGSPGGRRGDSPARLSEPLKVSESFVSSVWPGIVSKKS
jgi:hypothetical protein